MKLKNKKTGKIVDLIEIVRSEDVSNEYFLRLSDNEGRTFKVGFSSLAELNEEWEDAPEEPKDINYWYIDDSGRIRFSSVALDEIEEHRNNRMIRKSFGNYFETEEEAELAVRKLKAWKRLKDKGFKFERWQFVDDRSGIWVKGNLVTGIADELDLLFGGEE